MLIVATNDILILGPTLTSQPCSNAFGVLMSLHLPSFFYWKCFYYSCIYIYSWTSLLRGYLEKRTPLYWAQLKMSQTVHAYNINSPMKWGHPCNHDTYTCPKGVWNKEVPRDQWCADMQWHIRNLLIACIKVFFIYKDLPGNLCRRLYDKLIVETSGKPNSPLGTYAIWFLAALKSTKL